MSEVVTGDITKGIKSMGELALRISRFDSYRLFTLYENVKERKVMNVSGDQKYYLVFRSPKKEIRIPEYDPKGFFEVDKVNGCILFKITKKNAEDILSMRTAGERIFHIIRVFEERDVYGKLLNVTDEVEVYNGKWGDDDEFSSFSTENKVDLLTKALAAQIDKNAKLLNEYNDLLEKYNDEVDKNSELEKEIELLRSEIEGLQTMLNEYVGNTYDGTLLSTDTKYIAFENTMDNINFTEEQLQEAISSALQSDGDVTIVDETDEEPKLTLNVKVFDNIYNLKIDVFKNAKNVGSAVYYQGFYETYNIEDGDKFIFECKVPPVGQEETSKDLYLSYEYNLNNTSTENVIKYKKEYESDLVRYIVTVDFSGGNSDLEADIIGDIGTIICCLQ